MSPEFRGGLWAFIGGQILAALSLDRLAHHRRAGDLTMASRAYFFSLPSCSSSLRSTGTIPWA